jgi:hypothetical protein
MLVIDKKLSRVSLIIFFIGYLWGMAILGISIFGDFEATMFQFHIGFEGDGTITGLDCPVMMASSDTETITATFSNPTDSRISPSVWAQISEGFYTVVRDYKENIFLEPGESKQLQWTITADDAVYDHWVLIKVHVYSQYPLPASDGVCGVFVADMLGFTGSQVFVFSLVMIVLLMGLGIGMWIRATKRLKGQTGRSLSFSLSLIGGMVMVGLVTTIIGSYLVFLSAAMFVISLVTVLSFLLWRNTSL